MRLSTALLILVVVLCIVMPARAGQSILFLGDSLTAGLGVEPEEAYPHLVGQLLAADGIAMQIINGGQSGSTTASALSRLNWYARAKPDILFRALGANDGLRGLTIEEMGKNLEAVIIAAQGRGMRVLLAGMELPPNYGPEYTDAFRRVYADLADRYSFGQLRTSHEQNIILADVEQSQLFTLWGELREGGFATPNIGLLTDIICCPGGDFCSLANAKSIPIAESIQRRFDDLDYLFDIGELDLSLQFCIFGVDDLDRVGAGELALRDARSGDDDLVVRLRHCRTRRQRNHRGRCRQKHRGVGVHFHNLRPI